MKNRILNIFCLFLTFAFVANGVLPFIYPIIKANSVEKEISSLSKIFGNKIIICASDKEGFEITTTYEKLGKEQKKKFLAKYELPTNNNKKFDNYILKSGFSVVFSLAEKSHFLISDNYFSDSKISYFKFSRAPPVIS